MKEKYEKGELDLKIPSWDSPPFPPREHEFYRLDDVLKYYLFLNGTNFRFWYLENNEVKRFRVGKYRGTHAWAYVLKQVYETHDMIEFFTTLTSRKASQIDGLKEASSLKERIEILNEIGNVLKKKYGGGVVKLLGRS